MREVNGTEVEMGLSQEMDGLDSSASLRYPHLQIQYL